VRFGALRILRDRPSRRVSPRLVGGSLWVMRRGTDRSARFARAEEGDQYTKTAKIGRRNHLYAICVGGVSDSARIPALFEY